MCRVKTLRKLSVSNTVNSAYHVGAVYQFLGPANGHFRERESQRTKKFFVFPCASIIQKAIAPIITRALKGTCLFSLVSYMNTASVMTTTTGTRAVPVRYVTRQ